MAPGDLPEPRVWKSVGQAWTNMWQAFWMLLLMALVVQLPSEMVQVPSQLIGGTAATVGLGVGALLVAIFVTGPLGLGLVKSHLAVSRGGKARFGDLAYGFSRYPQAVLLAAVSLAIIALGFALLIVPGIYLAVKLAFTAQRFVDDELDAMDAIRASFADTKGRWWQVFGLGLVSILLILGGVLALVFGVFIAIVWVSQLSVVYWRTIKHDGSPLPELD